MFDIYIPFYGSTFCVEYQAKTLTAFAKDDDVQIIFIDNNFGRFPEVSDKIKEVCNRYGFLRAENNDKLCSWVQDELDAGRGDSSDKLGQTLNLICNLALKRETDYFGFLDQDCFAYKPFSLKEYLDRLGAYGKVVPTNPESHHNFNGEWIWNLHVVANFYKTEFLRAAISEGRDISFLPGSWGPQHQKPGLLLDTGGMNWWSLWRYEKDRMKYVLPEEHYFYYDDLTLLDPDGTHPTRTLYEIIDDKWIHMVHGAGTSCASSYMSPKVSYVKGFLDLALLEAKAPGARPREEFTGTYKEKSLHESFIKR